MYNQSDTTDIVGQSPSTPTILESLEADVNDPFLQIISDNYEIRTIVMELKRQIGQMDSKLDQLMNVVIGMQLPPQSTPQNTVELNINQAGSTIITDASNHASVCDNQRHGSSQVAPVPVNLFEANRESPSSQPVESHLTTSPLKRFKKDQAQNDRSSEEQMVINQGGNSGPQDAVNLWSHSPSLSDLSGPAVPPLEINTTENKKTSFPESAGFYLRISLGDILANPNYAKTGRKCSLDDTFYKLLKMIINNHFAHITGTMHMALISSSEDGFHPSLYRLLPRNDKYPFVSSLQLPLGDNNNGSIKLHIQRLHQNTWAKKDDINTTTTMEHILSFPSGRLVPANCTCREGADKYNLYKPDLFIWPSSNSKYSNEMTDEQTNRDFTTARFDNNGQCTWNHFGELPENLPLTNENGTLHLKLSLIMNEDLSIFYQFIANGDKRNQLFIKIEKLKYNIPFTVCRPTWEEMKDQLFPVFCYNQTVNDTDYEVTCNVYGDNARSGLKQLQANRFSVRGEFVYLHNHDLSFAMPAEGIDPKTFNYIEDLDTN